MERACLEQHWAQVQWRIRQANTSYAPDREWEDKSEGS